LNHLILFNHFEKNLIKLADRCFMLQCNAFWFREIVFIFEDNI